MLIYFGVTPYLVFDGDNLPSKAAVERERAERREECNRRGLSLYNAGRVSQAHQELQKAVDVTPEMARRLIEELKRMNIQYVVAPYEADAQLAYLERKGIINGILSEDSDLLVFGAKRLLTKLDQHGDCVEINRADFTACRDISLIGWTDADFRCMAILSGCDYLPSINKMGLKTAYRYVRKYKNIEKILRMLSFDGQFCVPTGYLDKFKRAELTFIHHRVFCPVAQRMVMLISLRQGMKEADLPFLGKEVEPETAIGVACGDLDPMSKEAIPTTARYPVIRGKSFEPRRVTLGSTADLKGNRKPLDAWFKPKRIPLAELDPNSLCYSSTAIGANGEFSRTVEISSSTPQMRRSISALPDHSPAAEIVTRSAERTSFLARAAKMSTYRSPKRQRLCSDVSQSSPTAAKVSPFFNVDSHPNRTKPKRKGRESGGSDFSIHSDDSVERALMDLPDLGQPPKESKLTIFTEQPRKNETCLESSNHLKDEYLNCGEVLVPQSSPSYTDQLRPREEQSSDSDGSSKSPVNDGSTNTSQSTGVTSISAETNPEAFRDLLNNHTNLINQQLKRRLFHNEQLPSSQPEMTAREAEMVRIGQAALEDSSTDLLRTQNDVEELDEKQPAGAQDTYSINALHREDSQGQDMPLGNLAASIANTSCVCDTASGDEHVATQRAMPSEDLLVPNSEDDSESQSESEEGGKRRILDLSRFAFTPK